jgi:pimeloyl-ACP methyl ester carboxylesterase
MKADLGSVSIKLMQIEWNGSVVFYEKIGTGPIPLLLFHGYGQDHHVFDKLANALSNRYTCYSVDIFFHGQSIWPHGDSPISKEEWKSIIELFLKKESIQKFSLLGYSIGAKLALATFECFPAQTNEIFFIAPDGIRINFWYAVASYPWITRKLFKSIIDKPLPFFVLSRIAGKLGLVNPRVRRFAEHEMKSEKKRSTIYYTWVVYRKLRFDIEKLAKELNNNNVSVTIVVGKYDLLIKESEVKILQDFLHGPTVITLPSGHNRLLEDISANPEKVFTKQSDNRLKSGMEEAR